MIGFRAANPLPRWFLVLNAVSLALVAVTALLPLWRLWPLMVARQDLSLHYNTTFGVDLIGPWYQIFLLPAIGFAVLCANALFARQLYAREKVLTVFFAGGALVTEIVLFTAMIFITLLNV